MKRLFGKAPPQTEEQKKEAQRQRNPTLDDAVESLDKRGGTLDEKIKKLDDELRRHKEIIAKARPGPAQEAAKQRALRVLRQKKLYEGQRDQLYSQQFNVEQTSFAMASVEDTKLQVKAMKSAATSLKKSYKAREQYAPELNINCIDKLADDMADLMATSADIQDALGRNYSVPEGIDEDELLGELDGLEGELASEAASAGKEGALPSYLQDDGDLPAAPTAQPQGTEALPARV